MCQVRKIRNNTLVPFTRDKIKWRNQIASSYTTSSSTVRHATYGITTSAWPVVALLIRPRQQREDMDADEYASARRRIRHSAKKLRLHHYELS